jgi:hypothetical protein
MNTECAPEFRLPKSLLLICLLAALTAGCKLKNITDFYIGNAGASLPGRGLEAKEGRLVWTVNAGILNDRDLPPMDRIAGEALLKEAASAVEARHPWLQLRFILDQPLDAEYILSTLTRDKKALMASRKPENRVLDLDPADLEHNLLIEKLDPARISPLLLRLRALQSQKNQAGIPLVSARPESSLLQWRLFVRDQVRYDVILTNAVIFPDEIATDVFLQNTDASVRAAILPALGRSAMEQNGLLFSLHGSRTHKEDLSATLTSLLLLGEPAASPQRQKQLATLVEFHKSGRCPDSPASIPLPAEAKKALETAYHNTALACEGKKD